VVNPAGHSFLFLKKMVVDSTTFGWNIRVREQLCERAEKQKQQQQQQQRSSARLPLFFFALQLGKGHTYAAKRKEGKCHDTSP
jgi:hypothetical protein